MSQLSQRSIRFSRFTRHAFILFTRNTGFDSDKSHFAYYRNEHVALLEKFERLEREGFAAGVHGDSTHRSRDAIHAVRPQLVQIEVAEFRTAEDAGGPTGMSPTGATFPDGQE